MEWKNTISTTIESVLGPSERCPEKNVHHQRFGTTLEKRTILDITPFSLFMDSIIVPHFQASSGNIPLDA